MRSENMAKIALIAVRLPTFEVVNGKSWSPRTMISFIKMHKGRLTTYNASRANKINIVMVKDYGNVEH